MGIHIGKCQACEAKKEELQRYLSEPCRACTNWKLYVDHVNKENDYLKEQLKVEAAERKRTINRLLEKIGVDPIEAGAPVELTMPSVSDLMGVFSDKEE